MESGTIHQQKADLRQRELSWDYSMLPGQDPGEFLRSWATDLYCCGPNQCGNRRGAVVARRDAFFGIHSDLRAGWFDPHLVHVFSEVAELCRERQAVSHKTESVSQVALLPSSVAFYDKTPDVLRAYNGEHNATEGGDAARSPGMRALGGDSFRSIVMLLEEVTYAGRNLAPA